MMLSDIVKANRSYRRFFEQETVTRDTLLTLVDYARLVPSGGNKQALRYYIACEQVLNGQIFAALGWAGYLKEWDGPVAGERPAAYIVLVQDKSYKMVTGFDAGIAAQTILLGATEIGLGGCMIGNIQHAKLQAVLNLADNFEILLVIALGKPKETVVIEKIEADDDIRYWRDEHQVHHVPKRQLKDIIIE
ncbi:MAG TPA: nitroreductase family protein [Methylomusa anaerophila]|uniref:Nitroreductase A n=1 Tax=Methylomusa anaerophila TaxID=1930071 RepID=A0A348AF55_9FIRM|nr:nitroreductase family protein [Methylomusa anaerophila]BBB89703.1 nitroreductase A [Methylomusa anaerophila]HML89253.1 nitroreductase family protein [Methylomusa anaerophila]